MKRIARLVGVALPGLAAWAAGQAGWAAGQAGEPDWATLERQFATLPIEARRLTGPLFWLHGDEPPELLEAMLGRVAESGNGCFTAESRPHNDWLGEGWYRDLAVCLGAAKRLGLEMWIFDERWWPSQMLGGKVPPEYGSKTMVASAVEVDGPQVVHERDYGGPRFIGAVAGRVVAGGIDGASLLDLGPRVRDGVLRWEAPPGKWRVMKFGWEFTGPKGMQQKMIAVDGASRECVEWFLKTVYQPHHERFGEDFGKTIRGYFYDEPETLGDWGPEVMPELAARKVDWKKALVAWKFGLAGDEQAAANYQYADAFAEAWGRTMYGGMTDWCRARGVRSIGHFMEHGTELFSRRLSAGNMFQLQKYSDMGGIDLVCRQFYPGEKKEGLWQMAKLGSSISHVYGKEDDVAMCEMFGAYGQDITYPQMKWLTDQMQVRGINFMIPHSFNPRAPHDTDCPPFFDNGGYEPRYPLHRVYCDYTNRLSLLLSGGRHVAPVAFLFLGQSYHAGAKIRPDGLTDALDDALFDCDWMPYDAFAEARIDGAELALHGERYRVLVAPAAEVVPYQTLAKVKEFHDAGGIVVGYGILPSKSATLGRTSAEMAALSAAVWGENPQPSTAVCRTNGRGGRSYFLPAKPTPQQVQQVLTGDAGVQPALEVVEGDTGGWLHVLHRVKSGRDVFLVCNQNHQGAARRFRFKVAARGEPEAWDPMRNEFNAVACRRVGPEAIELDLTLEPSESVVLVFQPERRALPPRSEAAAAPVRPPLPVVRAATPPAMIVPSAPPPAEPADRSALALDGCPWVWFPAGDPAQAAPPGRRFFRGTLQLPAGKTVKQARFVGTCDNALTLHVNGREAGRSNSDYEGWREPATLDLTKLLGPGPNTLAIDALNLGDAANPAGLIGRCEVTFTDGTSATGRVDATWKAADREHPGWQQPAFDDRTWPAALVLGDYGRGPWGRFIEAGGRGRPLTTSPVTADPFLGHCDVPAEVDLTKSLVHLECTAPAPEDAAHVTVNGKYAGGFIGAPYRLDVTRLLKPGRNEIAIVPFAPQSVQLVVRAAGGR